MMELLKTVPRDVLAGHMEKAVDSVVRTNDAIWLYWMFELIHEKRLEDRIRKMICAKQKKEVIKLISSLFYELQDDGSYELEALKKNASEYEYDSALSAWVSEIIETTGIKEADIQKERASHVNR